MSIKEGNNMDVLKEIANIQGQISDLPIGNLTVKKNKTSGKDYYYLRFYINGKRYEKYVSEEELPKLREEIELRKQLEKTLKELEKQVKIASTNKAFNTNVIAGEDLINFSLVVKNFKKRECFQKLNDYVYSDIHDKVLILYGLRRTGKTTLIRQILLGMSKSNIRKAAFIQVSANDDLYKINDDLRLLEKNGFKYIFIDEVTLMEDFIDGAALFSDIYASCGMKIVLSGTDSLGFAITKSEQLYDRCIMLHTTFIPYREFENVLGIKGIEEYIQYGGTMSMSGINYNDASIFASRESTSQYIDSSIAKNIQHSLKYYDNGSHFRRLYDLYEKNELTGAINRIIEDINHAFTKEVLTRKFKCNDLSLSARNLLTDRNNSINIYSHLDKEMVVERIKNALEIIEKNEQKVKIEDDHSLQIKEYLEILDLIEYIDVRYLPHKNSKNEIIVIKQPGLRYSQAKFLVESLMEDERFNDLSAIDKKYIIDRILSEIKGRMMEEIVLLETKLAKKNKDVFKLQFAVGEFDMVVQDPETLSCDIYEIKYSKEQVSNQYRHLIDEEKCGMTEHRYGKINGRYVIYRGDNSIVDSVSYLNVEEYLKGLGNNI